VYSVVTLTRKNHVGNLVRSFRDYTSAVQFLVAELPNRPNLDMIHGRDFVPWEFADALVTNAA
jgi:hypothetical protein